MAPERSRTSAYTLTSAKSPSDVYSIDTADRRKLERWTESETGGLDAAAFSEPETISWKSFDGRTITGFLYRPPASFAGPRPVIVNIHGGPEAQYQPGFLGRNNFYLNELGVAMIYPNVRGSTGYGKTFVALDNGEKREDSVKDIGALLDWIAAAARPRQGPRHGDGRLVRRVHDARVDDALQRPLPLRRRRRRDLELGHVPRAHRGLPARPAPRRVRRRARPEDARVPPAISPLTNAAKITKPIFIVQGRNDPRVPYTEAEQMVAAIKKNGGPVWYLLAKDEGHGFTQEEEPGLPVPRDAEVRR